MRRYRVVFDMFGLVSFCWRLESRRNGLWPESDSMHAVAEGRGEPVFALMARERMSLHSL